MLVISYFKGLDAERVNGRAADSFALSEFLAAGGGTGGLLDGSCARAV